jgi:hypothetical protein
MDLVKQKLGPEIDLSITVNGGVLEFKFERNSPSGTESFIVTESLKYFIDKEKAKLPPWMQGLVNVLEGALP